MKRPNRERVGKALELLRQGLAPYVAQEFGRHYDDRALIEAQSILPRHDRLNRNLQIAESDVAPLMRLMLDSWNNVFDSTLGRGDRTLVHEVREWRDKMGTSGAVFQR